MDVGRSLRTAGNVEVAPARRAAADEDCVPAFREQRLETVDALPAAELDPEIEDVAALLVDDRFREPKTGDLRADHAAGLGILIEHHAGVAKRREVARNRERGGAAADERDAFAVRLARAPRQPPPDVVLVVGSNPFQSADRHRVFFHPAATAGGFAGPVAGAPKNSGKHVGFPVDHVRVAVATRRDQADVFGNRGVCRASPLAIHDLVEIVRGSDVGILHWLLVPSTLARPCCPHASRRRPDFPLRFDLSTSIPGAI